MAKENAPQAAQPKDEISAGFAAASAPQPGPAAGPKVRFLRPFGQWTVNSETDRFPIDSALRLIAEGKVEIVDPAEFAQYKAVYDKRLAEEARRVADRLQRERDYRDNQARAIKGSFDRAIKPEQVVTR